MFLAVASLAVATVGAKAQSKVYPQAVDDQLVIQGDKCGWDAGTVHTFSVVEANKDGYKYWGYYASTIMKTTCTSVRRDWCAAITSPIG